MRETSQDARISTAKAGTLVRTWLAGTQKQRVVDLSVCFTAKLRNICAHLSDHPCANQPRNTLSPTSMGAGVTGPTGARSSSCKSWFRTKVARPTVKGAGGAESRGWRIRYTNWREMTCQVAERTLK